MGKREAHQRIAFPLRSRRSSCCLAFLLAASFQQQPEQHLPPAAIAQELGHRLLLLPPLAQSSPSFPAASFVLCKSRKGQLGLQTGGWGLAEEGVLCLERNTWEPRAQVHAGRAGGCRMNKATSCKIKGLEAKTSNKRVVIQLSLFKKNKQKIPKHKTTQTFNRFVNHRHKRIKNTRKKNTLQETFCFTRQFDLSYYRLTSTRSAVE